MQKVLITEKGLLLQQDVKQELVKSQQQKKTRQSKNVNHDYNNNNNHGALDGIAEENTKTFQRVQLDYLQSSNKDINKKCQTEGEIQNILLQNQELLKQKSPYIIQKLQTATQSILNPPILSPIQQKNDRDINYLFTSTGPKWGLSQNGNYLKQPDFSTKLQKINKLNKHSTQTSFHLQSNNSLYGSNIFQNPSKFQVLSELVQQSKQNQLTHYESKFQRLIDNWQNLQEQRVKQKNLLEKSISKSLVKQKLNTRPETLSEIKQKHQDALDIIGQENYIKERAQVVFYQLHQKNIQKKWQNTYFPTSLKEKKEKGIKFTFEPYKTTIKKEKNDDIQLKISKVWKNQK